jgi:capsular polysaccharide biosynthesis protein
MSVTQQRGQAAPPPPSDDDWDAEQEVDFRRYWDALAARWWLPLAGLVVGAIVGYAISLGGNQVYKAQATLYLGQPYSASGNVQLQSAQTNPSTVRQIVNARSTRDKAAAACASTGLKAGSLRGAVSVASVSGNLAKLGQTPEVTVAVQLARAKRAACAANALARTVIDAPTVSGFANGKIKNFLQAISQDEQEISAIDDALKSTTLSTTDRLVLLLQLRPLQQDRIANTQLVQQARQVEAPRVIANAAAERVTARSRRNSVVVAAIVGLLVGLVAALGWEAVASRAAARRPAA